MANAILYADRWHVASGANYVLENIAQSAAYRGRVVDQGHTRDKGEKNDLWCKTNTCCNAILLKGLIPQDFLPSE